MGSIGKELEPEKISRGNSKSVVPFVNVFDERNIEFNVLAFQMLGLRHMSKVGFALHEGSYYIFKKNDDEVNSFTVLKPKYNSSPKINSKQLSSAIYRSYVSSEDYSFRISSSRKIKLLLSLTAEEIKIKSEGEIKEIIGYKLIKL